MNKILKIIDKYLDDPLLESSNPRSRINSMRKEIEASVKNGQIDALVRTDELAKEKMFTLDEVKEIAMRFTRAATPSKFIMDIDKRFETVWELNKDKFSK